MAGTRELCITSVKRQSLKVDAFCARCDRCFRACRDRAAFQRGRFGRRHGNVLCRSDAGLSVEPDGIRLRSHRDAASVNRAIARHVAPDRDLLVGRDVDRAVGRDRALLAARFGADRYVALLSFKANILLAGDAARHRNVLPGTQVGLAGTRHIAFNRDVGSCSQFCKACALNAALDDDVAGRLEFGVACCIRTFNTAVDINAAVLSIKRNASAGDVAQGALPLGNAADRDVAVLGQYGYGALFASDAAVNGRTKTCRQCDMTAACDVAHHRDGFCRIKRDLAVFGRAFDASTDIDVAVLGIEIHARAGDAALGCFTNGDLAGLSSNPDGFARTLDAAVNDCIAACRQHDLSLACDVAHH